MKISEIIVESSRASLWHGVQLKRAVQELQQNYILGYTTQRYWDDGTRKKDNDPDYQSSKWMKGVSLTRDPHFAKVWGHVVFEFDYDKLRNNYKIVPFNWMYSIPKSLSRKKEREEFLILHKGGTYMRELDSDDIESGVKPTIDTKELLKPEGKLNNLNNYLIGIYLSNEDSYSSPSDSKLEDFIKQHPKFKGIFDGGKSRDIMKKSGVKVDGY